MVNKQNLTQGCIILKYLVGSENNFELSWSCQHTWHNCTVDYKIVPSLSYSFEKHLRSVNWIPGAILGTRNAKRN